MGTPTHSYDETGGLVWERELDIYGAVRKEKGDKGLVPQLYQGQYIDEETGLAYNRFRYYDNESGGYISQDPIGLGGATSRSCRFNCLSLKGTRKIEITFAKSTLFY